MSLWQIESESPLSHRIFTASQPFFYAFAPISLTALPVNMIANFQQPRPVATHPDYIRIVGTAFLELPSAFFEPPPPNV
jgi:hypothetical protein